MGPLHFGGREAWLAGVERALSDDDASHILGAVGVDAETVLAVAAVEAAVASEDGVCSLGHARVSELTGLSRAAVLRGRLALIELGLIELAVTPGLDGRVCRELLCR